MTTSFIREGNKIIPEVDFVAVSPNDNKDSTLGALNLPINRFEGTDEKQRHRSIQGD